MDDNAQPVDWWFATGTEYVSFDADTPVNRKLILSPHHVAKNGALPNTLNQLEILPTLVFFSGQPITVR